MKKKHVITIFIFLIFFVVFGLTSLIIQVIIYNKYTFLYASKIDGIIHGFMYGYTFIMIFYILYVGFKSILENTND